MFYTTCVSYIKICRAVIFYDFCKRPISWATLDYEVLSFTLQPVSCVSFFAPINHSISVYSFHIGLQVGIHSLTQLSHSKHIIQFWNSRASEISTSKPFKHYTMHFLPSNPISPSPIHHYSSFWQAFLSFLVTRHVMYLNNLHNSYKNEKMLNLISIRCCVHAIIVFSWSLKHITYKPLTSFVNRTESHVPSLKTMRFQMLSWLWSVGSIW
jgi:hypothetical protein